MHARACVCGCARPASHVIKVLRVRCCIFGGGVDDDCVGWILRTVNWSGPGSFGLRVELTGMNAT